MGLHIVVKREIMVLYGVEEDVQKLSEDREVRYHVGTNRRKSWQPP